MKTKNLAFFGLLVCGLCLWLLSCTPSGHSKKTDAETDASFDTDVSDVASDTDGDVPEGSAVEELGTYEHVYEGTTYTFHLLRIERTDGKNAYVMHAPINGVAKAPLVVLARPYDGIDWTGEPVDAKWAQRYRDNPGGMFPDDDEPNYIPGVSSNIYYQLWTLPELAQETNYWLVHGISPMLVFGRYYAGEDIASTARVMQAALRYAANRQDVDVRRVGITGGSWGGFMTIYGASLAPPEIQPVAADIAGPVDFEKMIHYITQEMPTLAPPANASAFSAFFEPYVRRIQAGRGKLGGTPDSWTGFTTSDVCIGLYGDTLVLHDDWDTLVPFSQSSHLQASCSNIQAVFWTHDDPLPWASTTLTHGPASEEVPISTMHSFAYGYILARLAPLGPPRYFAWTRTHMQTFLLRIRALKNRGAYTYDVFSLLREWLSPSSFIIDFGADPPTIEPANEALAHLLSEVWEESIAPETVDTWLASH